MNIIIPKIKYAYIDDLTIAYQVWGTSKDVLIYVPGIVSHLEVTLEFDGYQKWLKNLSNNFKVIIFDKRGQGMSDREMEITGIEPRIDDITAVAEAEGIKEFSLFGLSEGAAIALFYAATYPNKINSIAVLGSFANVHTTDDSWIKKWGEGISGYALCPHMMPKMKEKIGKFERMTCNPKTLKRMMETNRKIDIRSILSEIKTPTLICHSRDDMTTIKEDGRYIAEQIKGAKYIEYSYGGHLPYFGLEDDLSEDLTNFYKKFTKSNKFNSNENDKLATILFTDIVESTSKLASFGDKKWSELMDVHDNMIVNKTKKYQGHFIKNTGDGSLIVFDGPIRAIKYALEFQSDIKSLGIECRCGLHIGQIEWRGSDVSGIAVNIASRVMNLSDPNKVLITKTLGDLIAGSKLNYSNFGEYNLKGIEGSWDLLEILN